MTGDDAIFGNSEDDDLYGEAGSDWISGGTGEDGILGDDGLIKTSRNDLIAEPLYSIDALEPEQTMIKKNDPVNTNALNAEISTPGNIQRAIINVEGDLKKTVDLLAFDGALANVETLGVNDIIYGGLNADWIHAGGGDDAVSGAEALPAYYTGEGFGFTNINTLLQTQQNAPINDDPDLADNPFWFSFAPYNPGDILRYEGNTASDADDPHGKTTQEFALYDEFNPRRKIKLNADGEAVELADDAIYDFLLNFNVDEGPLGDPFLGDDEVPMMTDGDDKIFGDLGNDWIVGGTGRDHMYGGRGDDLLFPGEYVENQPILKLAQIHPLYVEIFAPVELLGSIKIGLHAEVTPEKPVERVYKARVKIVDRVVDAASGTFGVRLELPNPEYALPAGLKCTVTFNK